MGALRLRIEDVDCGAGHLVVREGKGHSDRITMLPAAVEEDLRVQIAAARRLHQRDLASGYGRVVLPKALSRKYPNAAAETAWQYVFPSRVLSVALRSGERRRHH